MSIKLNTALSIYNAVSAVYPKAVFKVTKINPAELLIQLTPNQVLRVSHSVNQFLLNLHLMELNRGIQNDSSLGHQTLFPDQADEPLSELAEFTAKQREIFESKGKSCVDVLVEYLQNPNSDPTDDLRTLGLDPAQLTQELALPYFKKVEERFPQLLAPLKARYSAIFATVQLQLCQNDLNAQRVSNFDRIVAKLKERVLGQELAITTTATALDKAQKKQGSHCAFLFVGPTGVGKTALAEALGSFKGRMIIFRMNQYPNREHVTTFFGTSTGYLGSDDKPHLAKELDLCPEKRVISPERIEINNVLILLDEIEKAHSTMRQSLLSLADIGEVEVSYTSTDRGQMSSKNVKMVYKLTNSILVATSNLFASQILEGFQRNETADQISATFEAANLQMINPEQKLSLEFLGRFRTIPFGPLNLQLYKQVWKTRFERFVAKVKDDFKFKQVEIENADAFFDALNKKHYGNGTDVRKIERYLKDVDAHITSNHSNWGELSINKLVFCTNQEGQILMKIFKYSMGEYVDLSPLLAPYVI